jgi:hypothetical protein
MHTGYSCRAAAAANPGSPAAYRGDDIHRVACPDRRRIKMDEQKPRLATQTADRTNDSDVYVSREESLISQMHQPADVKVFYRKDAQADGGVKCKICVEIGGNTWCVYVNCDDIVIKKPKAP